MAGGIGPLSNLMGKVNANNELVVDATVSVSGADGSILDGVDPLIKATVKDYSNSNPLAVVTVDTNGDYVSGGGGTQYTEDAAAPANPTGTAPVLVRADTPAGVVTTDGDWVSQRATNYGAAYVQIVSSAGAFVDSFGGGTQYNQGTASTDTDTGTVALVVRRDTPAVATGVADGDRTLLSVDSAGLAYARLRQQLDADTGGGTANTDVVLLGLPASGGPVAGGTSTNPLQVSLANTGANATAVKVDGSAATQPVSGTVTVTQGTAANLNATVVGTGTFAVQATVAAAATNIAKAEDAASADGDVGVPALAVRKATPANTSGADGDYEFLQMSAGRLWASATIDTALPAGTNAIGKLAANSGVDIGDVDVTSVTPGTAATNLGKAEDAAHTTGDVGVMALGVRNDTPAALSGTDGDYEPFQMNAGRVWTFAQQKRAYAAKATITITLTSLANGSARESTVIDNTSNKYSDCRIRVQTKGQASGTSYIDWYVYTALGDTTYTDLATGSDAAFTAANRFNSRYIGSTKCNANTTAVTAEMLMSDVFVTCPDKWGLIAINNTGAALSATGGDHVIEYEGIY